MIFEAAQHAAYGEPISALAALRRWPDIGADINEHFIGIRAIDLLVEIGEVRGHARIDLDDSDAVSARIVHHLDIEHSIVEADPAHDAPRHVRHALLDVVGKRRRIFEPRESQRAREKNRIDHAKDIGLATIGVTLDRDLDAFEQSLGEETLAPNLDARLTLKHAFER